MICKQCYRASRSIAGRRCPSLATAGLSKATSRVKFEAAIVKHKIAISDGTEVSFGQRGMRILNFIGDVCV